MEHAIWCQWIVTLSSIPTSTVYNRVHEFIDTVQVQCEPNKILVIEGKPYLPDVWSVHVNAPESSLEGGGLS